jgi:hypothetical protein
MHFDCIFRVSITGHIAYCCSDEIEAAKKQISGDLNKLTLERFEPISARLRETLIKLFTNDSVGELKFFVTELLTRVRPPPKQSECLIINRISLCANLRFSTYLHEYFIYKQTNLAY